MPLHSTLVLSTLITLGGCEATLRPVTAQAPSAGVDRGALSLFHEQRGALEAQRSDIYLVRSQGRRVQFSVRSVGLKPVLTVHAPSGAGFRAMPAVDERGAYAELDLSMPMPGVYTVEVAAAEPARGEYALYASSDLPQDE